jgi:pyruvate/2-oxoglutarate dehydrogenase complex dihydrolipoamide acyltransferase (E2) component
MRTAIAMPTLGMDMETGRIAAWLMAVGDAFERGQPIAEIETDKATVEMEALQAGTLAEIVAAAGAEVAVGEPIAYLEVPA